MDYIVVLTSSSKQTKTTANKTRVQRPTPALFLCLVTLTIHLLTHIGVKITYAGRCGTNVYRAPRRIAGVRRLGEGRTWLARCPRTAEGRLERRWRAKTVTK